MIRTQQQMQVISHQAHRIQAMWNLLLRLREHRSQHITPQAFGNQELTAVAPQGDVKRIALRKLAW